MLATNMNFSLLKQYVWENTHIYRECINTIDTAYVRGIERMLGDKSVAQWQKLLNYGIWKLLRALDFLNPSFPCGYPCLNGAIVRIERIIRVA